MSARILPLAFVAALAQVLAATFPSVAETIKPSQATSHLGQSATVEGIVSDVYHAASGNAVFIDIGGRYPKNQFAGVIFSDDEAKFPEVDSLRGQTVDLTGTIKLYRGRPEIILTDPTQIRVR
jgi:DNA/RNA endonuclease YhcR with UshA esterase domain